MSSRFLSVFLAGVLFVAAVGACGPQRREVPPAAKEEFGQAAALMRGGKIADSIPILEGLAARYPGSASISLLLLHAYEKTNDLAKWRALLETIEGLDPFLREFEVSYAKLERLAGNAEQAKRHADLANVLTQPEPAPEAEAAAPKAAVAEPRAGQEQAPASADPAAALAALTSGDQFVAAKRYEEAVQAYVKAYQADQHQVRAVLQIGYCLYSLGQFDKAVPILLKATQLMPQSLDTWTLLGNTYVSLNKAPEALQAYQAALQLKPGDPKLIENIQVLRAAMAAPADVAAPASASPSTATK